MSPELTREDVLQVLTSVKPFADSDPDSEDTEEDDALDGTDASPVDWTAGQVVEADAGALLGLGEVAAAIIAALHSGKHVVLMGPPGTGKTTLAEFVCKKLSARFDLVTATSDWSTFDTMGGYLPDPDSSGGAALEFTPGVVLRALAARRWIVIDELNRADIDKAFGELFTVLGGVSVQLPFRKDGKTIEIGKSDVETTYRYEVPGDWRIIGTMNTFDKASLYQLSFAFMRRFAFIYVPVPDQAIYQRIIREAVDGDAAMQVEGTNDKSFRDEVLRLLGDVFAPNAGIGLEKLGLLVGPAIARDIARFLRSRFDLSGRTLTGASAPEAMLTALEMYLYPQFEGKHREHVEIGKALSNLIAIPLTDVRMKRSMEILRSWTGFDPAAVESSSA